jgi:hypothetical protein
MALVDTRYVPSIADSRRLALARLELITDRLRTPTDASRFLLWFFALRVGPLRQIPEWLQSSAEACMGAQPGVAVDLFETAKLERGHQLVMLEDLVAVLQRAPGVDFRALIRAPFDPRIEQHLRIRKLVPIASVPAIVLAIDLELALLDRDGGELLLDACARTLGSLGSRFLRLRQQDANRRIDARMRQLRAILDEPQAATSWAKIASRVLLSYVGVLDAGAARRSAPHSGPPDGPASRWPRRFGSDVEVAGVERVLGDELAAGADLVAHQDREHVVG